MQDFKKHILEAIELNTQRLPLYAQLTANQSIPYSKKLINYEKLILTTAWLVDIIGDRYQKNGVPFISEEFIDMSRAPSFKEKYPSHINYAIKPIPINIESYSKNLKAAVASRSSSLIVQESNVFLKDLEKQPHLYCMTRHLIESIRRIAHLIPLHEARSTEQSIRPPVFYSWTLIKSHLLLLNRSREFDESVVFIQEMGIPFLWQDLPTIDTNTTYNNPNTHL